MTRIAPARGLAAALALLALLPLAGCGGSDGVPAASSSAAGAVTQGRSSTSSSAATASSTTTDQPSPETPPPTVSPATQLVGIDTILRAADAAASRADVGFATAEPDPAG